MKVFYVLVMTVVLMFASITVMSAQTKFELPKNIELNTEADCKKYEKDFVAAAKWLEEEACKTDLETQRPVNLFVFQWILKNPYFTISLNASLTDLVKDNAQLLLVYSANFARYYIENKDSATVAQACKAGVKSVMYSYQKGGDIKKSEEIEKLLKLTDEREFDAYIEKFYK